MLIGTFVALLAATQPGAPDEIVFSHPPKPLSATVMREATFQGASIAIAVEEGLHDASGAFAPLARLIRLEIDGVDASGAPAGQAVEGALSRMWNVSIPRVSCLDLDETQFCVIAVTLAGSLVEPEADGHDDITCRFDFYAAGRVEHACETR